MTRGATRRLNAMPHPNEELLRRGKEAFLRGDIDTVKELLADDTPAKNCAPGGAPRARV
jgi:hypothetical protein